MTRLITTTAAALLATVSIASAKAHNQGNTEVPGTNVQEETVATSQALGGIKGNRPDNRGPGRNNGERPTRDDAAE